MNKPIWDAIIIGAGAAGLMCAATAASRGNHVLVLEKSKQAGRKILMSGGGRCNFTNLNVTANEFVSNNPHFCKSALNRYTNWDFIGKVLEYEIPYHERDLGKLFCDDSAKDILTMLMHECDKHRVNFQYRVEVNDIKKTESGFSVDANGQTLYTKAIVIATGGLSIPSMGSSGFAYQVAKQFGLNVKPQRAGLVPLTFSDQTKKVCEALAGIALDCTVSILDSNGQVQKHTPNFTEPVLFTHRGLSGPAILQLSNYWQTSQSIRINLLPLENVAQLLTNAKRDNSKQLIRNLLQHLLPKSLLKIFEQQYWQQVAEKPIVEIANQQLEDIATALHQWTIKPSGTEGYRTAEVTLGGVDTDELSSKTMAAKSIPNLFFVGESVDVTGHLGGYNFQWAWSSGFTAGQHI